MSTKKSTANEKTKKSLKKPSSAKVFIPKTKQFPVPPEQRQSEYWKLLNNVLDPELGIGIVDLGLVYDIQIEGKTATVTMTFTSMACPVGPNLIARVRYEMESYPGIEDVNVNVVWTPVWTRDFIDPDIRTMMFDQ